MVLLKFRLVSPLYILLNVYFFSNHYKEIIESIGHVSWILEIFIIYKQGGNSFHSTYFPCLLLYNVLCCFIHFLDFAISLF